MASTMNVTENVAEEIKTGRPERYYDYLRSFTGKFSRWETSAVRFSSSRDSFRSFRKRHDVK
jgi:hypothetical protein